MYLETTLSMLMVKWLTCICHEKGRSEEVKNNPNSKCDRLCLLSCQALQNKNKSRNIKKTATNKSFHTYIIIMLV